MDLLVIEDDAILGKAVQRGLIEAGHQCEWVRNGQKGFEEAQSQQFDVIVLDLLLPDLPGIELIKRLRAQGQRTPVLMIIWSSLSRFPNSRPGWKRSAAARKRSRPPRPPWVS